MRRRLRNVGDKPEPEGGFRLCPRRRVHFDTIGAKQQKQQREGHEYDREPSNENDDGFLSMHDDDDGDVRMAEGDDFQDSEESDSDNTTKG